MSLDGFEILKREYLGRGFILGHHPHGLLSVTYFLTGRSPPSQARTIIPVDPRTVGTTAPVIRTEVTDPKELQNGNPALLLYTIMRGLPTHTDALVVSNGAQTDMIAKRSINSKHSMHDMHIEAYAAEYPVPDGRGGTIDITSYEPDGPTYTPRISGIIYPGGMSFMRAFRSAEGTLKHDNFNLRGRMDGYGALFRTYDGSNVRSGVPIPASLDGPALLDLNQFDTDPRGLARDVFNMLEPKRGNDILEPGKEFRVGVASVLYEPRTQEYKGTIITKHGREQEFILGFQGKRL